MPSPNSSGIQQELASAYRLYAALAPLMDPDSGLGGTLLFAGPLDPDACRLVRAANIAGAASLAVSEDAAIARQAMRDGVIDFVVTSLDESLRILKNEVRKRQPVAVAVTVSPADLVDEMLRRGVLPDLLPPLPSPEPALPDLAPFVAQGARRVQVGAPAPGTTFLSVPVPAAWAQRSAEFDALLLQFLLPGDHANRRWLRLSPRYLGTQARRIRSLQCDAETASNIVDRVGRA